MKFSTKDKTQDIARLFYAAHMASIPLSDGEIYNKLLTLMTTCGEEISKRNGEIKWEKGALNTDTPVIFDENGTEIIYSNSVLLDREKIIEAIYQGRLP